METLGRVLDPEEVGRRGGPIGRLSVDVLPAWLASGDAVEIVVPQRLACARCDGGGCDGCGRSGAFRLTLDDAARTLQLTLPGRGPERTVLRLVRPFGADAGLEQLWIELRAGPEASACCRLVPGGRARPRAFARGPILIVLALALAVLLAVLLGALTAG